MHNFNFPERLSSYLFFFVVFAEKHFHKILDYKSCKSNCVKKSLFKSNSQLIYSICNNLPPNNQHEIDFVNPITIK